MPKKSQPSTSNYSLERPPVIAVMGHVDHGKTSFLDAIRNTSVQEGEAGGITQNTRAHEVDFNGQKLTFIDTPGHEAFSDMRSRGANVTDIVCLVVAADDGIQPQTIESIKFAKASNTPIVVAINKIDLPGVDTAKIKNQLSQYDVLVEDYGGDVQTFEISALKKTGLDEILDGILVLSEILELKKGKPSYGMADGIVLESKRDDKLGAVSIVLLKSNEIHVGNFAVSRQGHSAIRAIMDEHQVGQDSGSESQPVWIVGLNDVLPTGEMVYFTETLKEAKKLHTELQKAEVAAEEAAEAEEVDDLSAFASLMAGQQRDEDIKRLNVVIKTDTQGTLEVVEAQLLGLNSNEVEVNILDKGTGDITRKDVLTAKNAAGLVIGFQVAVDKGLMGIIQEEKVLVRVYSVIYELIDEVSGALEGLLEPEFEEEEVARAEVKKVFTLSDGSLVAGCLVTEGKIIKGYQVWVERGEFEEGRGKITVLKRNKDEVKEVPKGIECGIMIDPQVDIQEGDEIVAFKLV